VRPPAVAVFLLRLLIPRHLREDVRLELREEYRQLVATLGPQHARRWYWRQVLGSIAHFTLRFFLTRHAPRRPASVERSPTMPPVTSDIRYALRTLRKSPSFAVIALLTLALGIGATTAVFSVVRAVLLSPLPFRHPERLVMVGGHVPGVEGATLTSRSADLRDFRERGTTIEELAASWTVNANITGLDQPLRAQASLVTENYFRLLGRTPAIGRDFRDDDAQGDIGYVVLLSHEAWQRYFSGDPNIVGRSIRLDDDPMTIIGVMPPDVGQPGESPTSPVEMWVPIDFDPNTRFDFLNFRPLEIIGRLSPRASLAASQAEFKTIGEALQEEFPQAYPAEGWTLSVVPLLDRVVGSARIALLVVFGSAGLLLLIACTNVANLMLARGSVRSREIAIRTALGGGRSVIARQFLAESIVLGLAGGVLGLGIAVAGTAGIRRLAQAYVPRLETVQVDGWVLLFALVVSIGASLLFGLIPALRFSKADPHTLLKEGTPGSGARRSALRRGLVVVEVAVSFVLLAGSGLLLKSFDRLMSVDPGFVADSVMTFKTYLPWPNTPQEGRYFQAINRVRFYEEVLRRLEALPSIRAAGLANQLPLRGQNSVGLQVEGMDVDPTAPPVTAEFRTVSPDYFDIMGITVVRGHGFESGDTFNTPPSIVVDLAFADRYFAGQDPLQKRVRIGTNPQNPMRKIIGVVGNVRHRGLDAVPQPTMYANYHQFGAGIDVTFAVRPSGPFEGVARAATEAIHSVDPELPIYAAEPMVQIVADTVAFRRLLTLLIIIFGGAALALAGIGMYGVQSFAVAQRTREIGIRMALGAAARSVMGMVLREGLAVAALGAVVGALAAALLSGTVSTLLFQVDRLDPLVFGAVALVAMVITAGATIVPARRATRVDPVITMRTE